MIEAAATAAAEWDEQPPAALAGAARHVFGQNFALAVSYTRQLATNGVVRGLIGPREAPRLWERHLLNCAVVGEIIPTGSVVIDVGSGAGLPGIPLALARPDLTVLLIESLARRVAFLEETVALLGLRTVTVFRGRAEDYRGPKVPVVTARAVASLDRLARWCFPLLSPGGQLLAMKGISAVEEIAAHASSVTALGGKDTRVLRCGGTYLPEPATVVAVTKGEPEAFRRRFGRSP